ncbi:F-box protein At5g49610-like [Malania oleifera]|uniref:F-box protein At5g49610-like n=1 Tax=Malania oleifera TaxID=397392 RepID=UPI0025ADA8A2|nr:F-box protein At5g49610-like [Malania oleifera]
MAAEFSSDIIFEILTRVFLQTLGRCRVVCKQWNALTYESSFMHDHRQRTKAVSGYFIQELSNNLFSSVFVSIDGLQKFSDGCSAPSLDFLPAKHMQIVASSYQGLLCCVNQQSPAHIIPKYYVCKPCTRQWRAIPNPKTRYFTDQIAMIVLRSHPLHFKIVRLSRPKILFKFYYNLRCEVFDSENWAWKQLDDVNLPYSVFLQNEPAVVVGGMIHWLTTHDHLLTFRHDSESWSMVPVPHPLYQNSREYMYILEYKGRLAIVSDGGDTRMELWVAEDYEKGVWAKKHSLSMESVMEMDPYPRPMDFYNSDVVLMIGYFRLLFCKFQDQNFNSNVTSVNVGMLPRHIFCFGSDWEFTDFNTKPIC